jgi:hypothetical protein
MSGHDSIAANIKLLICCLYGIFNTFAFSSVSGCEIVPKSRPRCSGDDTGHEFYTLNFLVTLSI